MARKASSPVSSTTRSSQHRRVAIALLLSAVTLSGIGSVLLTSPSWAQAPSSGHAILPSAALPSAPTPSTSPALSARLSALSHPAAAAGGLGYIGDVPTGNYPSEMVLDPTTGELYVSNLNDNNVTVISAATNTVVATVLVGTAPLGIAYDSKKGEIFVANSGSENLSVISEGTHKVVATIPLFSGAIPTGVAFDPATNEIWATTLNGRILQIADSNNTQLSYVSFPSGVGPVSATYDSGKREVFVALRNVSFVVAFSDTNISNYAIIGGFNSPWDMAYDPARGYVYVADETGNKISIINDTSNLTFANPTGLIPSPEGIAYDPGDGYILVASDNGSQIKVIDDLTNTQIASVPTLYGGNGWGVVWDEARQTAYLADTLFDLVEVIGRVFTTNLTATTLPVGLPWTVWLNGSSTSYGSLNAYWFSTESWLAANLPNGSYQFTVQAPYGFIAHPTTGTVVISGASVGRTISFAEEFNVTFTESGLASGTSWSVVLNGTLARSTTTTIVFPMVNGSFSYSAGAVPGYEASPASGSLTVTGAVISRSISFAIVFPLWFNETGLPSGTSWSVSLAATGSSSGTLSNSSSTASIEFIVGPGYHADFTVSRPTGYTAQPETGSVSTSATGAPTTESVEFSPDLAIASFTATPSTVSVGDQLTLKVTISGGLAPFTYSYVQLPTGCASQNSSSVVCAPTATGLSIVVVTVSDKLGRTAEANVSVQVNSASSSSTVLGLPSTEGYGLLAVIVLIVVALVVFLAMRMRGKPPAASSAPPASPPSAPGGNSATPPPPAAPPS